MNDLSSIVPLKICPLLELLPQAKRSKGQRSEREEPSQDKEKAANEECNEGRNKSGQATVRQSKAKG